MHLPASIPAAARGCASLPASAHYKTIFTRTTGDLGELTDARRAHGRRRSAILHGRLPGWMREGADSTAAEMVRVVRHLVCIRAARWDVEP